MGDIHSVKVKGVGVLEFELTTIEKFIGDDKFVNDLEKHMGNKSGFEDEYVYMDEDYTPIVDFLESKDKEVGDMVEMYNFIDPTSRESLGVVDGVEISKCKVVVPKGNDILTFNAIEANTSGSFMLLFRTDDIAEVTKGMYETTFKDLAKLETKVKANSKSKIIEEEEELEEEIDFKEDDDFVSLEDLDNLENDEIEEDLDYNR